jgi:hypothetical protein
MTSFYRQYPSEYRRGDRDILTIISKLSAGSVVEVASDHLLAHIRQQNPDTKTRSSPDIFAIPQEVDAVICDGIFCTLDTTHFISALGIIYRSLTKGGHLIALDFLHPFDNDVTVSEDGGTVTFRPIKQVTLELEKLGFSEITYEPKSSPVSTKDGDFRGIVFQPWCILTAVKS